LSRQARVLRLSPTSSLSLHSGIPRFEAPEHSLNMAAWPEQSRAERTSHEGPSKVPRSLRNALPFLFGCRPEYSIIDQAARERRDCPIQVQRLRDCGRLLIEIVADNQHRPNRTLRSREQGSVARNQNALLDTANRDQLDIGNRLVGDKRVVSGCPQPASEPRKHPIT
jgi:hypothetical protein